ncbi:hypothetical protein MJK72_18375 [Klebsiella pneumoniae]|nr:hypothetical protein MJK72_18375 [Klebsiella pneumoniae]
MLEYLHAERRLRQTSDGFAAQPTGAYTEGDYHGDRIPQREVSAPYGKNGFRYRQVYEPGCEYAIYQRRSVLKEEWDEWEVLLDASQ